MTSFSESGYTTKKGNWTIFPLLDGYLEYDKFNTVFDDKSLELHKKEQLKMVVQGFLAISKEGKKVLIDAACGENCKNHKNTGNLLKALQNLKAPNNENYKPKDITDILLTHDHFDHAGRLFNEDKKVFHSAKIHLHLNEINKNFNQYNYQSIQKDKTEVLPQIVARQAFGYSAGHTIFLIDEEVLVVGDMIHDLSIQLANPKICATFDSDPKIAIANRRKFLKLSEKQGIQLCGPHFLNLHRLNTHPNLASLKSFNKEPSEKNQFDIYAVCNEWNLKDVYKNLQENKPAFEGEYIHVGCAGWYNFDIMCIRKSNYGCIFDLNANSTKFMRRTLTILKRSKNRQEFVNNINSYYRGNNKSKDFFTRQDIDSRSSVEKIFKSELSRANSWLSSDENFAFIQNLALQAKICVLDQDILNVQDFKNMHENLLKENIKIDTVYTSNLANFFDWKEQSRFFNQKFNEENKKQYNGDKEKFEKTLLDLLADGGVLISSPVWGSEDQEGKRYLEENCRIRQVVLSSKQIIENPNRIFISK